MIITITPSPSLDKTAEVKVLRPGSLNRLGNLRIDAGGKGVNVARAVKALGGDVLATGFAGGAAGKGLTRHLDADGIAHDFVAVQAELRSNLKILDGEAVMTEFNEAGPPVSAQEWAMLESKILSLAAPQNLFVLAGSLPAGTPNTCYRDLALQLRAKGAQVFVDADGDAFRWAMEAPPDFIKPNRQELAELFGIKHIEEYDIPRLAGLCRQLLGRGVKMIALSLGAEGALFFQNEEAYHAPGLVIEAHSSAGAGDAMVAALCFGFQSRLAFRESIALAVACSAGACITLGTQAPTPALVKSLLPRVDLLPLL